jgi:glucan phosphorylase
MRRRRVRNSGAGADAFDARTPSRESDVRVRVWRIRVGRVPLYLLDGSIPQNSPEDRAITGRLYAGHEPLAQ